MAMLMVKCSTSYHLVLQTLQLQSYKRLSGESEVSMVGPWPVLGYEENPFFLPDRVMEVGKTVVRCAGIYKICNREQKTFVMTILQSQDD